MRCEGITASGTQCKKKALKNSKYCHLHRPKVNVIEEVGQCQAVTNAGHQCKRAAEEDDIYCYQHQPSSDNLGLTELQKRFCEEYVVDMKAGPAAERAGYSKGAAAVVGCNMLKKAKIQTYVNQLKEKKRKELGITRLSILEEIAKIAFIDITDFFEIKSEEIDIDDNGVLVIDKARIKDLNKLKHKTSAIHSIKETKYGIEIRTHAKTRMLEKLLDHVSLDKNAEERVKMERERIELERERIELEKEKAKQLKFIQDQKLKLEEYKVGLGKSDIRPVNIVNDLPIPKDEIVTEAGDSDDSSDD